MSVRAASRVPGVAGPVTVSVQPTHTGIAVLAESLSADATIVSVPLSVNGDDCTVTVQPLASPLTAASSTTTASVVDRVGEPRAEVMAPGVTLWMVRAPTLPARMLALSVAVLIEVDA